MFAPVVRTCVEVAILESVMMGVTSKTGIMKKGVKE